MLAWRIPRQSVTLAVIVCLEFGWACYLASRKANVARLGGGGRVWLALFG